MSGGKILVVDDEPGVRAALAGILRDERFEVTTVSSGEEALRAAEADAFDAVLLDVWLPGRDGLETLTGLRERRSDAAVVMISGHGTIETAVRATKLGAFDFVEKPLSLDKTLLVLRNALRQRRLERRNRRLVEQLSRDTEIVGQSPAMERLRSDVAAAAASTVPVLLCGERGTGRETLARRIHATGARADEAFVEVACATLEAAAAEEILLGHGPRARLDLAAGGSLFLADADGLPKATQRRLATRLGERGDRNPDVRLLASCGPGAGGLEPRLHARLDVARIDVPPLRAHRDDVPRIAERFMADLSREYGSSPKPFEEDALRRLRTHAWPGNVRELRNLVERLLAFAPGPAIRAADLPEELGGSSSPAEDLYREFGSLEEGLRAFERYYVARIVSQQRGDLAAAAARLGISEAELRKRTR